MANREPAAVNVMPALVLGAVCVGIFVLLREFDARRQSRSDDARLVERARRTGADPDTSMWAGEARKAAADDSLEWWGPDELREKSAGPSAALR